MTRASDRSDARVTAVSSAEQEDVQFHAVGPAFPRSDERQALDQALPALDRLVAALEAADGTGGDASAG
ncbi:hypothetical protein [Streptomyces sp. NPDC059894]|uniref:hypothetical protein n=1 Tax=Streptomyces sp. NPDC059894 TaxID=3346991 RepID=UPI003667A0D2